MLTKIKELKNRTYFGLSEWNDRGLNISSKEVVLKMRNIIDNLLLELIEKLSINGNIMEEDIAKFFQSIENNVYLELDTEEKEFLADTIVYIGSEIKLNENKIIQLIYPNYKKFKNGI